MTPLERFWAKVEERGEQECWPWLAGRSAKGYGHFGFRGTSWQAHRASWVLFIGEIPEGKQVLHTCDNPGCVNPKHLFLGTNLDNVLDRVAKGRSNKPKGEQNGRAKLTAAKVLSIRSDPRPGAEIARELGLGETTIYNIKHERAWAHV